MSSNIIFKDVDITPLLKAQKKFELFIQHLKTEQEKAGAVQAFEFCYELCWKTLKRVLNKKGLEVASPRDAFRLGAQNHLINNPESWFEFQLKRNLTTHTYNDAVMVEVIAAFSEFSLAMQQLIERLQRGDQ